VVRFATNLLFYEYAEVMAELEESNLGELRDRIRGKIENERKGVWLEGIC
jgi:hypothetical protein